MEPTDYPPMSGSNAMCVVTVLLETGMVQMVEPKTRLVLETPGGVIEALAECRDGKCERVDRAQCAQFRGGARRLGRGPRARPYLVSISPTAAPSSPLLTHGHSASNSPRTKPAIWSRWAKRSKPQWSNSTPCASGESCHPYRHLYRVCRAP